MYVPWGVEGGGTGDRAAGRLWRGDGGQEKASEKTAPSPYVRTTGGRGLRGIGRRGDFGEGMGDGGEKKENCTTTLCTYEKGEEG